jgi:hypothetical protein
VSSKLACSCEKSPSVLGLLEESTVPLWVGKKNIVYLQFLLLIVLLGLGDWCPSWSGFSKNDPTTEYIFFMEILLTFSIQRFVCFVIEFKYRLHMSIIHSKAVVYWYQPGLMLN